MTRTAQRSAAASAATPPPPIEAAAGATPRLRIDQVGKSYGGVPVLRSIAVEVRAAEILGIAGENGAGKSTLLKVVSGIVRPDAGTMTLDGGSYSPADYPAAVRAGIAMVFQEQALVPNLCVYENMFLAHEQLFRLSLGRLDRKAAIDAAARALRDQDLEHIDPRRRTGSLGFEDRQAVEIARAFALATLYGVDTPIILLDEPTAGITEQEAQGLFKRVHALRDRASFVLVTHRLQEYLQHCDRLYVFKDGENVGEVPRSSMSERKLHELMVGRERSSSYYKEDRQGAPTRRISAEPCLEVQNLVGHGVNDVSLSVRSGEVLGIGGLLGCGKGYVGRAIAGARPFPSRGNVRVGGRALPVRDRANAAIAAGVGYVPRERKTEGLIPYLPLRWNASVVALRRMRRLRLPWIDLAQENRAVNDAIARLRIKSANPMQLCAHLSGGNQQKVVLAKWLMSDPKVLVLDNPTRGVDVGAKEEIYALIRELAEQGLAVLLISDDMPELIGLSDRILVMREGRVVEECASAPGGKPSEAQLVAHMV